MFAIQAAIIQDAPFNWFLGIARKVISPCMLEIRASEYKMAVLENDSCTEVLEELQTGPLHCHSYLRSLISEILELFNRTW